MGGGGGQKRTKGGVNLFFPYNIFSFGDERKGYGKRNQKKKEKKDERKGHITTRYIKVYYIVLCSYWRKRPYAHSSVEEIGASVNRPPIGPRIVDFWAVSWEIGPFVGDSSIWLSVARWAIYSA